MTLRRDDDIEALQRAMDKWITFANLTRHELNRAQEREALIKEKMAEVRRLLADIEGLLSGKIPPKIPRGDELDDE